MDDLGKILSFEIKKEIAERYFGFRKIIEDDSDEYQQQIISSSLNLEKNIGFDLIRIYILLHDNKLINKFLKLTGLSKTLFFDPYILKSPTIKDRVFANTKTRGFTRKRRIRFLLLDMYKSLKEHTDEYYDTITKLIETRETIKEEINLFYKKNDIAGIMLFLRNIDGGGSGSGPIQSTMNQDLDNKMRLKAPPSVEKLLPILPAIPPEADIKKELIAIAKEIAVAQPHLEPQNLGLRVTIQR